MATRRNVNTASVDDTFTRTISPAQGGMIPPTKSDTRPAVPSDVLTKLLAFTLAMVVLPIGSYFFTLKTVFKGHASYAGGFAALMANVVLIAYVIVAMREDQGENPGATGVDVLKRKVESQSLGSAPGQAKKDE